MACAAISEPSTRRGRQAGRDLRRGLADAAWPRKPRAAIDFAVLSFCFAAKQKTRKANDFIAQSEMKSFRDRIVSP